MGRREATPQGVGLAPSIKNQVPCKTHTQATGESLEGRSHANCVDGLSCWWAKPDRGECRGGPARLASPRDLEESAPLGRDCTNTNVHKPASSLGSHLSRAAGA